MIITDRSPVVAASSERPQGPMPVRRLAQFGVICLLLTWLPWAALGLTGTDIGEGAGRLIFGPAASGPSLARQHGIALMPSYGDLGAVIELALATAIAAVIMVLTFRPSRT